MANLKARIEALEALAGVGKTHFIWVGDGADVKAEIARRIEAGTAAADDRFYSFAWQAAGGPEKPMHPDPYKWPSRDAPPPAANDG